MEKIIKLFVYVFFFFVFSNTSVVAKCGFNDYVMESLATAPPIVTTPTYLCQNSVAVPLTAIFLSGSIHNWYLTNTPAEIPTFVPPKPNTSTVGSTTYYVSQTIGSVESIRVPIVVKVVADTNAVILGLTCDSSQILAPATIKDAVFFDWGNNPLTPGNVTYNYEYTIQGGALVSGQTTNASTHLQVSNLFPGQSVTLTITSVVEFPCVPSKSITCSVSCGTSIVTPTFPPIATSYCLNETPPSLPNPTNSSIITGSWNPLAISTNTVGTTNYIFTPNPVLFPCVLRKTVSITVKPLIIPTFLTIPTTVCQNSTPLVLPLISSNASPIIGTWNPSSVNTSIIGIFTYTFTANSGQCASTTPIVFSISVVNPPNTLVSLDWTVSDAFAENQMVTVIPTAAGTYVYQLDSGPFQTNPIFENVASGIHSITVKDSYGCNSPLTENNVLVINYPRFFTPNDDGFNDTWNIFDLKDQTISRIYIFDRYGKLLKEISPKGAGWDGNYIGHPVPSTDYWFTVDYAEQSIAKKFKSHFSLKR